MTTRRHAAIAFSVAVALLWSCTPAIDDFTVLKQYKPEDKYFTASLKSLHFIIETSDIARVDTVFRALLDNYGLPTSAKGCRDGVFTGASPYDAYDYKHVVTIEIEDEEIVAVDYDEIKKDGKGKQGDSEYNEEMSAAGTSPAVAYPVYERSLLEKQNMMEVDSVSGASYSLFRFRYAIAMALMKASL